ncbi:MAG: sulfur carrier protein ThiS [Hyphomicrobium sp.]
MDGVRSGEGFEIVVNGRLLTTSCGSLAQLVAAQTTAGAKIATAVNGHFVPAVLRATTLLQPGDRVEIVSPRQGG